jgi:plastocyanin
MEVILSQQINVELIYPYYNKFNKGNNSLVKCFRRIPMNTKPIIILLLALMLTACGPKTEITPAGTLPPVQAGEVKISIANFAFDPATLTIPSGTTVTWTNNDSASHNVTGDDGSWGSKSLATGGTFSYTFTKAGTFSYHCGVHPSMIASITVVAP